MELTNRQIQIIEAATILIGEKGIQNLTIKNLAQKMSFSEPALYRHFKSKTEILKSVLLYYKGQLRNKLEGITSSQNSGIDKIKLMMDFQFNHFANNPAVIMVIFAETSFQYDNILSKTVAQIMQQKRTMVETILKTGQEEGSIRNDIEASQLTITIMGSMRFTILKWRLANYEFDLLEEGKVLWGTLEKLIKKE